MKEIILNVLAVALLSMQYGCLQSGDKLLAARVKEANEAYQDLIQDIEPSLISHFPDSITNLPMMFYPEENTEKKFKYICLIEFNPKKERLDSVIYYIAVNQLSELDIDNNKLILDTDNFDKENIVQDMIVLPNLQDKYEQYKKEREYFKNPKNNEDVFSKADVFNFKNIGGLNRKFKIYIIDSKVMTANDSLNKISYSKGISINLEKQIIFSWTVYWY